MSRAAFEPLTRFASFAELQDIASLRAVTVKGARWAHEAQQWGAAIVLFGPDGRQIGKANTIPEAITAVRRLRRVYD